MKIRVLAEETVYKECFVDVPEHILEYSKDRLSKTYLKNAIHNWLSKNGSDFKWVDYDFNFDAYTWEEVQDNE